jgi:hypothetical protein
MTVFERMEKEETVIIRILAAFWISWMLVGCSLNRAASLRMLDDRAQYEGDGDSLPPLREGGIEGFRTSPAPIRTRPKVADFWLHPQKTGDGSYFWGAWLSVLLEKGDWVLSKPGKTPKAQALRAIRHKSK